MTTVVFSGHRVDEGARTVPRLPAHRCLAAGRQVSSVLADLDRAHGVERGLAGAANGGDILFHESCRRLGIDTEVFLALPVEEYLDRSVRPAGVSGWEQRFEAVLDVATAVWTYPWDRVSQLWEGAAGWMLDAAFERPSPPPHLLALWDRSVSQRPGGTGYLVSVARRRGVPVTVVDTTSLVDPR